MKTEVTLKEFLDKCISPNNYTTQRQGQLCFNLLQELRPDLAEKCRDSAVDPFYNDSRVSSFILLGQVDVGCGRFKYCIFGSCLAV